MSDLSDWDVEKYKNDYESDEHWQLKRDFMEGNVKNVLFNLLINFFSTTYST